MNGSTTFARWARVGLFAAAALMGVALLATVWTTYRGVSDASQTLIRGQADVFHEALRSRIGRPARRVDPTALSELVEEYRQDGLRYIAVLGPDGSVRVEAGDTTATQTQLARLPHAARVGAPIEDGDRVRVWYGKPNVRQRRGRRRWLPATVVVEFEPVVAHELRAAAGRSLGIGGIAGAGFLLVALGMIRWALRREALERQLEHERRLASLGEMSAVLAHEIRNPLASLKGNAQLLARGLPEGERPRAKADLVVDEAVRLERLANDLLAFARAGEIHREAIDPAGLAREVASAVAPERISVDVAAAPDKWSLDTERIRQVLRNLLDNAVQAGDGPVDLIVARDRGALVFEVRDRGPGIAADDLTRIFEPFYTRRTHGTGLGLSVARRMVELHGGTITAANAPGGGAVFRVALPDPRR